nr:hypothetical protein GCM10020093_029760 [Planobispora longispora]
MPVLPPDADAVAELLGEQRGSRVEIRVPQRGDKRSLMETVERNAKESLAQHKLKRSSDLTARSKALQELADALDLDQAPLRIECYDVSHLQGTNVVASMVVFEDGLARKSEYRRFSVRSVEGDVASIHEVISRRFKRYLEERVATGELAELGEAAELAEAGAGPAESSGPEGAMERSWVPRAPWALPVPEAARGPWRSRRTPEREPGATSPPSPRRRASTRRRAAAQVRLPAPPGRRGRRPGPGGGRPAGPGRAGRGRRRGLRTGQAAGGGVAARRGPPGHPSPLQRGPLPPAAGP